MRFTALNAMIDLVTSQPAPTDVTSPGRARWQMPRIDRNDRLVGGVSAAIARELGVQALVIRVAFAALTLVVGWGLLLYVFTWVALTLFSSSQISPYQPIPKGATSTHRHVAIVMVVIGMMVALAQITPSGFTSLSWPLGFVLAGGLIAWSRGTEGEVGGLSAVARIVAGIAVAAGGIIAFAALSISFTQAIVTLIVGLAIVAGVVLVAAPSMVQMGRSLDDERLDRIRLDERARISAHLHDSVLQTLTLIQQSADDPVRTSQLARRQERELRGWLYGPTSTSPDGLLLGPAIERTALDVEEMHGVTIEVVAVGDSGAPVRTGGDALLAAAREAMVNAAKHSGVDRIDVFIERTPESIEVFIRDTGEGFDTSVVDPKRKGLSESIVARMSRAGGSATIHSEPGAGTEVELVLPIVEHDGIDPNAGDDSAAATRSQT